MADPPSTKVIIKVMTLYKWVCKWVPGVTTLLIGIIMAVSPSISARHRFSYALSETIHHATASFYEDHPEWSFGDFFETNPI